MRWRRWLPILTVAAVAVGTMANCRAWLGHGAATASMEPVYAWVLCEECDRGERARVVALGDTAVPLLRTLLLDGAPADRMRRMQDYLAPLGTQRPGRRPASPAVIAGVLSNYDLLYRFKAASALSAIGGGNALRALCEARGRSTDSVLNQAVDTALGRRPGGGSCP
jgi:HEAT repeat protein